MQSLVRRDKSVSAGCFAFNTFEHLLVVEGPVEVVGPVDSSGGGGGGDWFFLLVGVFCVGNGEDNECVCRLDGWWNEGGCC